MAAFADTYGVGDKLQAKDGVLVNAAEVLHDKIVGLYFSAHWCPPCRGFTPKLVEFYNKLKASGKAFEIVFVSSDKDEGQFKEYFAEMPWLSLPFSDRDLKNSLSKKYKVSGIPHFVILDTDGEVICNDCRSEVSEDPTGKNFPWRPKSISDLLGETFTNSKGETLGVDAIKGKTIGLYFSAHWCPPCKSFTPELAKTYEKVKASGKDFEIIFVSSDKDEGQFKEYLGEMPWIALPYSEREAKAALSKHYNVEGIPTLVMLDSNFNSINEEARGSVSSDPDGKKFPWSPPPVEIFPAGVDKLNDSPSFIALLETLDDGDQEEALAILETVALEAKASGLEMCFMVSRGGDSITPQIRKLTNKVTPKDGPEIVILDIGDDGAYYAPEDIDEITVDNVKKILEDFKAKKIDRKQLAK